MGASAAPRRSSWSTTRAVLVTGAGRGIGRAVAVRLARHGWRVYAGVRTDVAAKALTEESAAITPVGLDVTDREQVAALDAVLPDRLDALVNNVGIAVAGPVETLTPADMHRQLDANLVGPLDVTRTVLPRLRRSRGRVVFISSVNGRVSFPFTGLYNASKFAVEAVRDCLRVELGPFGVGVAIVEPGVIDTDPWHQMDDLIDSLEGALPPHLRELYAGHFAGERRLVAQDPRGGGPAGDRRAGGRAGAHPAPGADAHGGRSGRPDAPRHAGGAAGPGDGRRLAAGSRPAGRTRLTSAASRTGTRRGRGPVGPRPRRAGCSWSEPVSRR